MIIAKKEIVLIILELIKVIAINILIEKLFLDY